MTPEAGSHCFNWDPGTKDDPSRKSRFTGLCIHTNHRSLGKGKSVHRAMTQAELCVRVSYFTKGYSFLKNACISEGSEEKM